MFWIDNPCLRSNSSIVFHFIQTLQSSPVFLHFFLPFPSALTCLLSYSIPLLSHPQLLSCRTLFHCNSIHSSDRPGFPSILFFSPVICKFPALLSGFLPRQIYSPFPLFPPPFTLLPLSFSAVLSVPKSSSGWLFSCMQTTLNSPPTSDQAPGPR